VRHFEISNQFKRNRNFAVISQKYRKRYWKSTKYFETSQKPRVIPLKFCEMSLVLWNLINYCKITQFLIKFCKSLKDFIKILLKWLGKTVKSCLNFINFRSRSYLVKKRSSLLARNGPAFLTIFLFKKAFIWVFFTRIRDILKEEIFFDNLILVNKGLSSWLISR